MLRQTVSPDNLLRLEGVGNSIRIRPMSDLLVLRVRYRAVGRETTPDGMVFTQPKKPNFPARTRYHGELSSVDFTANLKKFVVGRGQCRTTCPGAT